jgi:uncharacterized protein (DUF1501 family)
MNIRSRRDFLKSSVRSVSAIGAASLLAKFGEMNALAANTSGYQALVCIFLAGGNDGHNMVIPISTAQQNFSMYQKGRSGLAMSQASLKAIANGSDTYGLHGSMPEMQSLYNQGIAAVVPNVGNLVLPITRAQYGSNNLALLPNSLFSHSDQMNQWQSAIPTGIAKSGWGGRITDSLASHNSSAIFPAIANMSQCGFFCNGEQTIPAAVPPPVSGSNLATGMQTLTGVTTSASTSAGQQEMLTFDNGLQLVQQVNSTVKRAQNYSDTLNGMLTTSSLTTKFPANNPIAAQLQTVANVMSVRSELGIGRQIFFCQFGSFDTHSAQLTLQSQLLQQLSQAVAAFYKATQELGLQDSVTTFTASEFGRTLNPNGSGGSDHAWGSHHFVVGGGVKGGKFYGTFPSLALGGDNDASIRGTLIPTTGIAQYGATLAQWFGVSAANVSTIFPNIANFKSSNLGFLG